MKQIVFSALAVCAASSLAFANESEDWLTLDQEIESLASSLSQGGSGVAVSAFVKTTYNNSSDIMSGGAGSMGEPSNDWGGFLLNNARVNFDGNVGDFGVHVAVELGAGTGMTAFGNYNNPGTALPGGDAYATFSITEQISGQAGFFRAPISGASLRDEDETLFVDRTFVGDFWANAYGRDTGVEFAGAFDQLGWWLAIQNGNDAGGDDLMFTGRLAFNALGAGTGSAEGAYGADDAGALTIAGAFLTDGDHTTAPLDNDAFTLEADYTMGALYIGASLNDMSDGFGGLVEGIVDPAGATAGVTGDVTMWDLTVSYMLAEDSWEIAGRYENLDDNDDTTVMTLGVNKYVEGHDAKWQGQWSSVDTDAATDADVITLGLLVSV